MKRIRQDRAGAWAAIILANGVAAIVAPLMQLTKYRSLWWVVAPAAGLVAIEIAYLRWIVRD